MGTFQQNTLQAAVASGMVGEDQPVVAFVDSNGVRKTIRNLHEAFPSHFQHAFAAKANTMLDCLKLVRSAGMSCEVASRGELAQALLAGFQPSEIVYDEPAKLPAVLKDVLARGVALNIDNFQEFGRVADILQGQTSESRIGFRINPQVGGGSIGAMSTATPSSKFGVALEDDGNRERIVSSYVANGWLNSLHSHVGSQGIPLQRMVDGIARVVALALEINARCGRQQVDLIDIGGGLPVNFEDDEVKPRFEDFADLLKQQVPELFTGEFRVKTEFGRSILAKNGFIATRVEYTKQSGGKHIVITHAGGQVATRTVFMPDHWKIRLSVHDGDGHEKSGESIPQDFAGPLCFAGT